MPKSVVANSDELKVKKVAQDLQRTVSCQYPRDHAVMLAINEIVALA